MIKRFNEFKEIKENSNNTQEIYDELEMRLSPSTGTVPHDEIEEVAQMYGKNIEDILDIVSMVYSDYTKQQTEEKEEELEILGEFAITACGVLGDKSFKCFKKEYEYQIDNSRLDRNTKKEALDKAEEIFEISKKEYPTDEEIENIFKLYRSYIKEILSLFPDETMDVLIKNIRDKYYPPFSDKVVEKIIKEVK